MIVYAEQEYKIIKEQTYTKEIVGSTITEERVIQEKVIVNQPVKWKKIINSTKSIDKITVPTEAHNVKINDSVKLNNNLITGGSVINIEDSPLTKLLKKILRFTGFVVAEEPKEQTILLQESKPALEIEYETPGPVTEEQYANTGKRILVSSDTHYENILTYTYLPNVKDPKLYRIVNGKRIEHPIQIKSDLDSDGKTDYIEWITPSLSNDTYEVDITVIDVQSYPTVGGNWFVRFNTTGTANLSISGHNGTEFGIDLDFLEVRCNDSHIDGSFNGTTAFYELYSCNETSLEASRVLTSGKHTLEFRFGTDVDYAYNTAGIAPNVTNIEIQPNITKKGRLVQVNFSVLNDTNLDTVRIELLNGSINYTVSVGASNSTTIIYYNESVNSTTLGNNTIRIYVNDSENDRNNSESTNIYYVSDFICGDNVTATTTLGSNVFCNSTSNKTGLYMNTSGVTLNCNSFALFGVNLSFGVLLQQSSLTIKNCQIGGGPTREGKGVFMGATTENLSVLHNNLSWKNRGIDTDGLKYNITIKNNTVFNSSDEGIVMAGDNITMADNRVINSNVSGIDFGGSTTNTNITNNNVSFTGSGGAAISLSATTGNHNITIISNDVSRNKNTGISIQSGSDNITINNNIFNDAVGGIRYAGDNQTFTGLNFAQFNITGTAISVGGVNNTIQHSNFTGKNGSGTGIEILVSVGSGSNITAYNNSIFNRSVGISITDTPNGTNITQNVIKYVTTGISLGGDGIKFFNNTIFNSTRAVLISGARQNSTFEGNNFTETIIAIEPAGGSISKNNTYKNNIISNVGDRAFLINGNDTLFYNNITNATKGIQIFAPSTGTNASFNIINETRIAIEVLSGANDSYIYNNTIDNSRLGMNIQGNNNTIWLNMFINSSKGFASSASGNYWNNTINSIGQGNWWGDVMNGTLNITDNNGDVFGDQGSDYPYNSSNRARVNGSVQDLAPLTLWSTFVNPPNASSSGAPQNIPPQGKAGPPKPPIILPTVTKVPPLPPPTVPIVQHIPASVKEQNIKCWSNYSLKDEDLLVLKDLLGVTKCNLNKIPSNYLTKQIENGISIGINELIRLDILFDVKPKFNIFMGINTLKNYKLDIHGYLDACSYYGFQGSLGIFCWPWALLGSLILFIMVLRFSKRIRCLHRQKKITHKNTT